MDRSKLKQSLLAKIRKYFLTGVIVWLPIVVTLYVIFFIVALMDKSIHLLPQDLQPQNLVGFHIPGIGLVLTLLIVFFTGMLVSNFFGRQLLGLWERFMGRIPLVRSIYAGVKQIIEALLEPSGKAFRKVYMIEYPRKGIWSIAFQTGVSADTSEVSDKIAKETMTLFVPTTPNPTSGFLLIVPKDEAIELEMSVDEALKLVISLGVVQPRGRPLHEKIDTANPSA